MKFQSFNAVISTTHDPKYSFFLPIVSYCWHKLGVKVICFTPETNNELELQQMALITGTCYNEGFPFERYNFKAPKHKGATYVQILRLMAASIKEIDDETILFTGDIDMIMFGLFSHFYSEKFTIWGADLVPEDQYPMCYIIAKAKHWRAAFCLNNRTYQQAIDDLLGDDECQDYRACRWQKDQEYAKQMIDKYGEVESVNRAYPNAQLAKFRVDRTDGLWREKINDAFDAHLWRNGYTDENFANILELLIAKYPNDDFDWLENYRDEFVKTLNNLN